MEHLNPLVNSLTYFCPNEYEIINEILEHGGKMNNLF